MDIQSKLNEVADHLEKVGWIQGEMFLDGQHGNQTPCCIMGAINVIAGGNPEGQALPAESDLISEVHKRINPPGGRGRLGVSNWNDAPERTFREVLNLLRGT